MYKRQLIKNVIRMENLEEEMAERQRILYVALTRAREKLFIVARCKNLEKTMEKCSTDGSKTSDIMSYSEIVGAGNMFDWMLKTANESTSIALKTIEKSDVEISEIKNVINESSKEKVIELIEKSKPDSDRYPGCHDSIPYLRWRLLRCAPDRGNLSSIWRSADCGSGSWGAFSIFKILSGGRGERRGRRGDSECA